MRIKEKILLFTVILFTLGFYSCSELDEHFTGTDNDEKNLLEILKSTGGAEEFVTALETTGLDKVVSGSEVFTVFVPSSGSFSGITGDDLKKLVGNHIMFGRYYRENLNDSLKLRAASGKFYTITEAEGQIHVNNRASLMPLSGTIADVEAKNGVIQSIDGVISTIPNIQELIQELDKDKYSIFLENYSKFDSINPDFQSYHLGFSDLGGVIMTEDPYWEYLSFNAAEEENEYTLLVPGNSAIMMQQAQLLEKNGGSNERISPFYYSRLIRNQMLKGAFSNTELFNTDTIITNGDDWVVGKKLDQSMYPNVKVASNGYIFESNDVVYKPIAADFIDSIVYEAEWSLGQDNHPLTLVYSSEIKPIVLGDDVNINRHLYAYSLASGNSINMFVPNVFKGLYQVKVQYQWSDISVSMNSEGIPITTGGINLDTYVKRDINNQDPNLWAYGDMGYVFLPEDGNLHVGFRVTRGIYAALLIDKIVLIPLEY